jgi:hypothetical protein
LHLRLKKYEFVDHDAFVLGREETAFLDGGSTEGEHAFVPFIFKSILK